MRSVQPEKDPEIVQFKEMILAKGAVEVWLRQIEDMMRITLKDLLEKSV